MENFRTISISCLYRGAAERDALAAELAALKKAEHLDTTIISKVDELQKQISELLQPKDELVIGVTNGPKLSICSADSAGQKRSILKKARAGLPLWFLALALIIWLFHWWDTL